MTAESWAELAACRDMGPEAFYRVATPGPGSADRRDEAEVAAKATCARCPVRVECLEYAVANGETHGIWGGLTPEERDRRSPLERLRSRPLSQRQIAEALGVGQATVCHWLKRTRAVPARHADALADLARSTEAS